MFQYLVATEKCNKLAMGRNYVNKYKGCLLQEIKKMLPNLRHYETYVDNTGKAQQCMLEVNASAKKIAKSFQNLGGAYSLKKVEEIRLKFYSFLSERMLSKIGDEVLRTPKTRLVISASEYLLICIYISNSDVFSL